MNNIPPTTLSGELLFRGKLIYVNRASEDFNSLMHNHDFIEFAYVVEGEGFHHLENQVQQVRKGQLFYIPIGTRHVFRPISADPTKHPLSVCNCVFSPKLIDELYPFVSDPGLASFIQALQQDGERCFRLSDTDDSIERLMMMMHREFSMPGEASSDCLNTLLLQFLIVVYRARIGVLPPAARKLNRFDHLLTYMEQNVSQELSLAHLAQISRWSQRHLQRLFIQHTSQTFHRCLQSLRVRKSCELLRHTTFKIHAISDMAGYRDVASFLAVFKRITGMTPSEYRKASALDASDRESFDEEPLEQQEQN
ncbi:AraC family transcriptional regulator [Cohnella boryungensis]|uniref:Helix-turn-helix domain-containing protein n=1 Tax=Cohnella boryungensis TaxID=768479 RepID=A0ABV8S4I4_9BACL